MSNRIFNTLRTLGWLIPMLALFYGVCADAFSLPFAEPISEVAAGFAVLCNGVVEKLRADYNMKGGEE